MLRLKSITLESFGHSWSGCSQEGSGTWDEKQPHYGD